MTKQEFIELLNEAEEDKNGNLYIIDKDFDFDRKIYFGTIETICDDFVKEYCYEDDEKTYYYNRHFTNNDDTIEIKIIRKN